MTMQVHQAMSNLCSRSEFDNETYLAGFEPEGDGGTGGDTITLLFMRAPCPALPERNPKMSAALPSIPLVLRHEERSRRRQISS